MSEVFKSQLRKTEHLKRYAYAYTYMKTQTSGNFWSLL